MFFKYFLFITLLSAVACQSTDELLGLLHLQVDKNCVRDKIGNDKYEKLNTPLQKCLLDFMQALSSSGESVDEKFASMCRNQDSGNSCQTEIMEALNPCLNDEQKNHVKYSVDSKKASIAYACDNQELIKESMKADKSKCETPEAAAKAKTCQALMLEMLGMTVENIYKKESCLALEKFTKCIADNLRSCAGDAGYKVMMGSFYAGFKATPCKEFVTGSSSMASFNIMLIAVVGLCCYMQQVFF